MSHRFPPLLPGVFVCSLLAACATPTLPGPRGHITAPPELAGAIPAPVTAPPLPAPRATPRRETYSVSVTRVPVQSVLFALARDAGMNIDIAPGIEGNVTLNALDQTLPQLLGRIARQVDLRWELERGVLTVLPDEPYWHNYKIDYVNMARSTDSSINIATQISTTGSGATTTQTQPSGATTSTSSAGSGNNNSTTEVENRSENNFWANLERNVRDMLRESTLGDPLTAISTRTPRNGASGGAPANQPNQAGLPAGSGAAAGVTIPAAPTQATPPENVLAAFGGAGGTEPRKAPPGSVIINPESGLLAVKATARQQRKIQEFLDLVLASARRQVLIEATVLEVHLSDQYQQGINWTRLRGGLALGQGAVGTLPSGVAVGTSPGLFTLNYVNPTSALGNISTAIQLLETFGKVKVLSSPKLSVLNNQTALLKVVDNDVFFTIKVTPAVVGANGVITTPATYESQLQTVPVGFVMSVTPQISDDDEVTLNVRPTITRIVDYVNDPNPALAAGKVESRVPVIQAREVESVLKVFSGDISMLGGLMQDSADNTRDGIPGLARLPLLGKLFSYRNESTSKTELVIFIRPVVVRSASIDGDYRNYRYLLPDQQALNAEPYSERRSEPAGAHP